MKKLLVCLPLATTFIACDNAANTEANPKDSLDSIANEKKESIDSSAEQRKEIVDSTTEQQKETLDRVDSLNKKKDSASQ